MQRVPKLLRFIHLHKSNFKGEIQKWWTFLLLVRSCPELHSLGTTVAKTPHWNYKHLASENQDIHFCQNNKFCQNKTSNNCLEIILDDLPWGPKGTLRVAVGGGNLQAPVSAWVSWRLLLILPMGSGELEKAKLFANSHFVTMTCEGRDLVAWVISLQNSWQRAGIQILVHICFCCNLAQAVKSKWGRM